MLWLIWFLDEPCECGIANDVTEEDPILTKIINGIEAKPNEFPWQVALVKAGFHNPICGGSIIRCISVSRIDILYLQTPKKIVYTLGLN